MEKYEIIEELGKGTFAVVMKAKETNTGDIVAIKKLKKKYSSWSDCIELREVKSLDILKKNDNIIKLKEMIRVEDTLHLVFEYMEKNLYEMMMQKQKKKFNEGQIRSIMWQTLQGIAYMHKYGFFHRDLKPENLLVNGEIIKIADFGLAREIRSLPPYTDYIATRYYRAPECILKSANYNSPIDIWALGCIMAELFMYTPIFLGNSEKEVLFRMCSILGTPTNSTWAEGIQLAKKIDMKFPVCPGVPLSQLITDASKDAIDLIGEMLKWDPNKRPTASTLLQHPFFTQYPIPNRLTTPDMGNSHKNSYKNFKSYSNAVNHKKKKEVTDLNTENKDIGFSMKNEDDDFSKILDDTRGFNEFIKKIKEEKYEEEIKFLENNKNPSPISKKVDEEFDFSEIDRYLKENNNSNNTLYSNLNITNTLLNANISNYTGLASTLTTNLNVKNQGQTIYNYRDGTFFDTRTLNSINGNVNSSNSLGNGSFGSNDKENIETTYDKEICSNKEEFYQSRRKNFINKLESLENNLNSDNSPKAENNLLKGNEGETSNSIKKRQQDKSSTELDFDNCNVYLKVKTDHQTNQSNTRKGSAYKFIEEKMKNNHNNILAPTLTTFKTTKDPIAEKFSNNAANNIQPNLTNNSINNPATNLNSHFLSNSNSGITNSNKQGQIPHKNNSNPNIINANLIKNPVITQTTQNNPSVEKKGEFQSRRKNIVNMINELDGKVIDINLNSNANNKSEIDKAEHHCNFSKKNPNNFPSNIKTDKDMMIGDSNYKKNAPVTNNISVGGNLGNINNTFSQNVVNNSILNNDGMMTINFASRRHINNTGNQNISNNIASNHINQNILTRHQLNKDNNVNNINSDKLRFY